jgi:hemerythrin-like domain-containing protein
MPIVATVKRRELDLMIQSNTRQRRVSLQSQWRTHCDLRVEGTFGGPCHLRKTKLTFELANEHRSIVHDLQFLIAKVGQPPGRFNEITAFDRLARSLNDHFRKEEQLLFPRLNRSLGSVVCDRLASEHVEIMSLVKQLGPVGESCTRLEKLLQAHISVEENVLFWYIDLQGGSER